MLKSSIDDEREFFKATRRRPRQKYAYKVLKGAGKHLNSASETRSYSHQAAFRSNQAMLGPTTRDNLVLQADGSYAVLVRRRTLGETAVIIKRVRPGGSRARQRPPKGFIRRARLLDRLGETDAALDFVYDSIDLILRKQDFNSLSFALQEIPVDELSPDLLLAVLTASLPARQKLKATRGRFFIEVESSLKRRGEFEDGLLDGLE